MNTHTPGPWEFSHRKNKRGMYSTQVYTGDGEVVAEVAWYPKAISPTTTGTYREDNARLIAAAPELLEALKWCADRLHIHMVHSEDLVAHMRACEVIAKATGAA